MEKGDKNPELTEFKDNADTDEPKVAETPAKSSSGMPKFQIDPAVFDEMPGTHFPAMQAKRKRSSAGIWIALLALLFLGAAGYAGYEYMQASDQNSKLSQKDQQIASLTQQKSQLEADAQKSEATPAEPAQPSDADQVKQAAIQYVCAGMTASCTNLKADAPKISTDYAKVAISDSQTTGIAVYLKRVKTSSTGWVAFFSSQNGIPKATVDKYSFPASLLGAGEVKDN